jgi:hypothetical protein
LQSPLESEQEPLPAELEPPEVLPPLLPEAELPELLPEPPQDWQQFSCMYW